MKILVATTLTNGWLADDHNECIDGELVYLLEPCARGQDGPDNLCHCALSFSGMHSHRSTTTALVVDSPLSRADVREAVRASLESAGWITPQVPEHLSEQWVTELQADCLGLADNYEVGTVVRRRGWEFFTLREVA